MKDLCQGACNTGQKEPKAKQFAKEFHPCTVADAGNHQIGHQCRGLGKEIITETISAIKSQHTCLTSHPDNICHRNK